MNRADKQIKKGFRVIPNRPLPSQKKYQKGFENEEKKETRTAGPSPVAKSMR
jgi:hypothetical protein